MKKTMQTLAIVLAIAATVQTLRAYATETGVFSIEEEEVKMTQLMELRKEFYEKGESLTANETPVNPDFPNIINSEQLNEAVARQALRYLRAIGAEDALIKVMKQPEFQTFIDRMEPGI